MKFTDAGGGYPHGRIPDERFRAVFGPQHHFHIVPPVIVGVPRFLSGCRVLASEESTLVCAGGRRLCAAVDSARVEQPILTLS
jgi:hypothetical protein